MSNMKRLQAYKFELRPDGRQERQMRRFAGSCRFVFNPTPRESPRFSHGEESGKLVLT